jgi:hypothetical protein
MGIELQRRRQMARPEWMPVFVLAQGGGEQSAAHPDYRGDMSSSTDRSKDIFEQRVGTAFGREDGGLVVELFALPVGGHLLIRPARESEAMDPTRRDT